MNVFQNSMYDDIVIGAGSSGAVIAARLSEDSSRRVLLLEAGNDYASIDVTPPELLNPHAPVLDGHNWHISAQNREGGGLKSLVAAGGTFLRASSQDQRRMASTAWSAGGPSAQTIGGFDYAVGKVVGGSSAINGALALRGLPEDYDEWAALTGDEVWSWPSVLASFVALESDRDRQADYHGQCGPIPVMREEMSALTPLQKAFVDTCIAQGYGMADDHNAPTCSGVGIVPKFIAHNCRMSTAQTHLSVARSRPNLHLTPNATVDRLHWKNDHTCDGVEVIVAGQRRLLHGQRVIVCAGALNTPSILMRSGVGNPVELSKLSIPVRIALRGVGENLIDHPGLALWGVPRDDVCHLGQPTHQALLRYTSDSSLFRGDMQIYMLSSLESRLIPLLQQALGAPLAVAVSACLMKPVSRGYLRLACADPLSTPQVVNQCLTEVQDMKRLKQGVRDAWKIIQAGEMRSQLQRVFMWTQQMLDSESALERAIATFVRPGWHVVGTAKMGRDSDPGAVVNARGRLMGADNVWVADASIMPTIPSAPTHLSCAMVGERIASFLL